LQSTEQVRGKSRILINNLTPVRVSPMMKNFDEGKWLSAGIVTVISLLLFLSKCHCCWLLLHNHDPDNPSYNCIGGWIEMCDY
jgi:hypothetical protein